MVIKIEKIAFFCIPAHGHTNPMLPVVAELVRRGNVVRFYSFDEFEKKIKGTGAEFKSFQPYGESFSDHYAFVGPSVFSDAMPQKEKERPLISSESIRASIQEILNNKVYGNAAAECSADFRACPGSSGAAEFIENAPH